jgi:hypothetical protein
MRRLQIRVVVVSVAVAALVFVALILGFVAESGNSKVRRQLSRSPSMDLSAEVFSSCAYI